MCAAPSVHRGCTQVIAVRRVLAVSLSFQPDGIACLRFSEVFLPGASDVGLGRKRDAKKWYVGKVEHGREVLFCFVFKVIWPSCKQKSIEIKCPADEELTEWYPGLVLKWVVGQMGREKGCDLWEISHIMEQPTFSSCILM